MRRNAMRGGHGSAWLCAFTLSGVCACGGGGDESAGDGSAEAGDANDDGANDDGASGDGASGDGTSDGSDDADGSASGECGKGAYPTQGEISLCPEAGEGCVAIAEARGYTSFYGNVNVRGVSDLSPLSCLESAGGLAISNAPGLEDLAALGRLNQVANLYLTDNADLESLSGLESLQSVDVLSLTANGLTDVAGLPSGFVVKSLTIEYHDELTSLAGLAQVAVTERITISHNPKLPQCAAEAYARAFAGVTSTVEDNDTDAICE